MMKLSLAVTLLFAVACKTDVPAPSAGAAPTQDSSGRARSAKIDIKPVAPAAGTPAEPPHLDDDREAWRKRREAKLDTDGDGKISDEERAAAMRERVVNMRARLDTDGDGKLTPAELAAGRGRMRFDDPASLDTNHDGDISADELAAGMKLQRDQRRAARGGDGAVPAAAPATATAPATAP